MKKIIVALCSAMVIFACNMLMPVSVCAEERSCSHQMYGSHTTNYDILLSTHPVYTGDGPTGPLYETCQIRKMIYTVHPKCQLCGYIDYGYVLETWDEIFHVNINCPLHNN